MPTPVVHRRWAREFLHRAQNTNSRERKLRYLMLAVDNTVRAQKIEEKSPEEIAILVPRDQSRHE